MEYQYRKIPTVSTANQRKRAFADILCGRYYLGLLTDNDPYRSPQQASAPRRPAAINAFSWQQQDNPCSSSACEQCLYIYIPCLRLAMVPGTPQFVYCDNGGSQGSDHASYAKDCGD